MFGQYLFLGIFWPDNWFMWKVNFNEQKGLPQCALSSRKVLQSPVEISGQHTVNSRYWELEQVQPASVPHSHFFLLGAVLPHCRNVALPLLGFLHVDAFGRATPFSHCEESQSSQLQQLRKIQEEVHVSCRLWNPRLYCCCVCNSQTQKLRNT